jgi:hypothetical protein
MTGNEPTLEDKNLAERYWQNIERNARSGNMLTARHTLAKILAEERERCAERIEVEHSAAAMKLRLWGRPVPVEKENVDGEKPAAA